MINSRNLIFVGLIVLLTFGCIGNGTEGIVYDESRQGVVEPMNALSSGGFTPSIAYQKDSIGGYENYGDGSMVTKTGTMRIRILEGKLEEKYDAVRAILITENANIASARYNEYAKTKEYGLTVKITPDRFDSIMEKLKGVGEIKSLNADVEDVTKQYTDLEIRITNREIELARLYEIYNRSETVDELLQVESQITRIESDLDSLKSQKQNLVDRIDRSTVQITLYEDKPIAQTVLTPADDLLKMFLGALNIAISLMVVLVGFLAPIAIVLGIVWTVITRVFPKKEAKK